MDDIPNQQTKIKTTDEGKQQNGKKKRFGIDFVIGFLELMLGKMLIKLMRNYDAFVDIKTCLNKFPHV